MRLTWYCSKIWILLKKLGKTGGWSALYLVHHYLKRDVHPSLAKKIASQNKKEYVSKGHKDLIIDTYDGSGQCVHPDVCFYKSKYWMIVTPYPYGMEEYENPSIYMGDSITSLLPAGKNPVVWQEKHAYGFHLSDPCIAFARGQLYCFYRESRRIDKKGYDTVWMIKYEEKDQKWTGKQKIYDGGGKDPVLSPAVLFSSNSDMYLYHVRTDSLMEESTLILTRFNQNFDVMEKKKLDCRGVPQDFFIWHVSIGFEDNYAKYGEKDERLAGLFLCRNKKKKSQFLLFTAVSEGISKPWKIEGQVSLDKEMEKVVSHLYKSCFIPNSKRILISFKDKKDRYRLLVR